MSGGQGQWNGPPQKGPGGANNQQGPPQPQQGPQGGPQGNQGPQGPPQGNQGPPGPNGHQGPPQQGPQGQPLQMGPYQNGLPRQGGNRGVPNFPNQGPGNGPNNGQHNNYPQPMHPGHPGAGRGRVNGPVPGQPGVPGPVPNGGFPNHPGNPGGMRGPNGPNGPPMGMAPTGPMPNGPNGPVPMQGPPGNGPNGPNGPGPNGPNGPIPGQGATHSPYHTGGAPGGAQLGYNPNMGMGYNNGYPTGPFGQPWQGPQGPQGPPGPPGPQGHQGQPPNGNHPGAPGQPQGNPGRGPQQGPMNQPHPRGHPSGLVPNMVPGGMPNPNSNPNPNPHSNPPRGLHQQGGRNNNMGGMGGPREHPQGQQNSSPPHQPQAQGGPAPSGAPPRSPQNQGASEAPAKDKGLNPKASPFVPKSTDGGDGAVALEPTEDVYPYIIVLIGPPGCGKSTMGAKLADQYKLQHLPIGEKLREMREHDSGLDRNFNMKTCSVIANNLLEKAIESVAKRETAGLVVEYVKTAAGCDLVNEMCQRYDLVVTHWLVFTVESGSSEALVQRIMNRQTQQKRTEEAVPERVWGRVDRYVKGQQEFVDYFSHRTDLDCFYLNSLVSVEEMWENVTMAVDGQMEKGNPVVPYYPFNPSWIPPPDAQ